MDLTRFKVGDIAEAQSLFVGVPLKGGKARLMIVLCALALLYCQQGIVR